MEIRLERGPIPQEEALIILDAWAEAHGIGA